MNTPYGRLVVDCSHSGAVFLLAGTGPMMGPAQKTRGMAGLLIVMLAFIVLVFVITLSV